MSFTLADAEQAIKNQFPFRFRNGTLRASVGWTGTMGSLPEEHRADVEAATYVVISYDTPIAWVRPDGTKILPDIGYSATTGQHQYAVKSAWGVTGRLSFPARGRELRPAGGGPRRGGIDSWR